MNNTNSTPSNSPPVQKIPEIIPYVTKDLEMTFTSSLIHSFCLIFFAELGDKTFIMLIIMQLRTNKATIFFSSIFAELLMNYIAIFIGRLLDLCLYKNLIEYLCIMFYLIYGLYIFGTGFTEKKETFESELYQIQSFNQKMRMDFNTLNETKLKKSKSLPNNLPDKKYNIESTEKYNEKDDGVIERMLTIIPEETDESAIFDTKSNDEDLENNNTNGNNGNNHYVKKHSKSFKKSRNIDNKQLLEKSPNKEYFKEGNITNSREKEKKENIDPFGRKMVNTLRRKSSELKGAGDMEKCMRLSGKSGDSFDYTLRQSEKFENSENSGKYRKISSDSNFIEDEKDENYENEDNNENENNDTDNNLDYEKLYENNLTMNTIREEDRKHVEEENIDITVFKTIFYSMALSECGDRTQLCTMTMSSIFDFWGVMLGSTVALLCSCILGVYFGNKVIKVISKKVLDIILGITFLTFSMQILLFKKSYMITSV